jgi:predicted metal-dependent hydrolase
LYGCDLFNLGYWWEAHEAWEAAWKGLPRDSVQGRFVQALIQVAAASLQAAAGEHTGRDRALERAAGNLAPALAKLREDGAQRYMGITVEAWWGNVQGSRCAPPPHLRPQDS